MCKISGRRHPLTPKIKVEKDSLAEQEMCFFSWNKTLSGIWTVFQYVANWPAQTRLNGRFAKSAHRSLPALMNFLYPERHQTALHGSKCPLTAYDCATGVFLDQYFHLKKKLRKSTLLVELSVSWAQLFFFYWSPWLFARIITRPNPFLNIGAITPLGAALGFAQ